MTTYFDCPPEAPTTRAFAGILAEGLDGATADEVLAVPGDLYQRMGLAHGDLAAAGARRHGDPGPSAAPGARTAVTAVSLLRRASPPRAK